MHLHFFVLSLFNYIDIIVFSNWLALAINRYYRLAFVGADLSHPFLATISTSYSGIYNLH